MEGRHVVHRRAKLPIHAAKPNSAGAHFIADTRYFMLLDAALMLLLSDAAWALRRPPLATPMSQEMLPDSRMCWAPLVGRTSVAPSDSTVPTTARPNFATEVQDVTRAEFRERGHLRVTIPQAVSMTTGSSQSGDSEAGLTASPRREPEFVRSVRSS
ncbi:hypothetical protein ACEPAG_3302 [Sanghuangporus baumii]